MGDGAPPDEWVVSAICEAFHCLPSVAVEEPLALALDIIELREYAETWRALKDAKPGQAPPATPMTEVVREAMAAHWLEKKSKKDPKGKR